MTEFRFKDQMNRELVLRALPKRIVSLVPSQTELLYDLGLDEEIVGITKFCVHPSHWLKSKTIVGGTKSIHIQTIQNLNPDLIIANKEENDKDTILQLSRQFPVWVSDVKTLEDASEMIKSIAELTTSSQIAKSITDSISENFKRLLVNRKFRTLYLIWNRPYMTVNSDTFIHDVMLKSGFVNVTADFDDRYPELSSEELIQLDPQLVLLSSEPFPFKQKHIEQIQALLPNATVVLVDGEMFSWYGSRLQQSPNYINELLLNL